MNKPKDDETPTGMRLPSIKVVVTVLVVLPLGIVTLPQSVIAMLMGIGAGNPGIGILLITLGTASCWFFYCLIVSLWLDRREASTVLGLIFGLIIQSVIVFRTANDVAARVRLNQMWEHPQHIETFGVGLVCLSGTMLTIFLLYRSAYPKRALKLSCAGDPPQFKKLVTRSPKLSANYRERSKPTINRMANLRTSSGSAPPLD